MNKFVASLVMFCLLVAACGPSAVFRNALEELEHPSAQQGTDGDPVALCNNRERRRADRGFDRVCETMLQLASTGTSDAGVTSTGAADANAATPAADAGQLATQASAVAPVVAPTPPRLCAGVDPSLLNVRSGQTMRTESLGFAGVYSPMGSSVTGNLLLQSRRYWYTVVINDQVQTASTGPFGGEYGGMIMVRTQSGDCLMPAYSPGRHDVQFQPNEPTMTNTVMFYCWARQFDPATGSWGSARFAGRSTRRVNFMDGSTPSMSEEDCRL